MISKLTLLLIIMFIQNKYTNWYHQIINNAATRTVPNTYTERHHIIPTSLAGSDSWENTVRLTAREHFVCHLLLTKMVDSTAKSKMLFALSMLTNIKNIGEGRYTPSSRLYEYARKGHSVAIKEWWTPERRAEASRTRKGRSTITPEGRARIRQYNLTKTWTPAALQNRVTISRANAENRLGSKWTLEMRTKMEARKDHWHTPARNQRLSEKYKGKVLSSGRRIGHWFKSPTGESILFCPLKHTANKYLLSIFRLNNVINGNTTNCDGWTHIRPATKEETETTIQLHPNQYVKSSE